MINRQEIIDAATRVGLMPSVVEKDYALGWVLAGIGAHPEISQSWLFKGGTCLKKCFFETYRFSEDLDFTLLDAAHLDAQFLTRVFGEISEWVNERTGLELPRDLQQFDVYTNPRGSPSCQGRLSYRGPISPRSGGLPRVKLDLTADEVVALPAVRVPVFHPYSDEPDGGITVLAYAYEEVFGEKVRALAERTRPRDLYDVVHLFRNESALPAAARVLDVLRQKCAFKGIDIPSFGSLLPHRPGLEGGWQTMLGHQLPALPALDDFWDALPAFFAWLETGVAPIAPAAFAAAADETVIRDRLLELPVSAIGGSSLEIIRFAAANRLCVDLRYQGSVRRIEPYSLRRTGQGHIVLHGIKAADGQHRSYRVDRIEGAQATQQSFVPRYAIELTPLGPLHIQPTAARPSSLRSSSFVPSPFAPPKATTGRRPQRPSAGSAMSAGPTYIYQCPICRKRFERQQQNPTLNPHKSPRGLPCPGRTGMFVNVGH